MIGNNKCEYSYFDGCYGHIRCRKNDKPKISKVGNKEYKYMSSVRCWWFRRLFCGGKYK